MVTGKVRKYMSMLGRGQNVVIRYQDMCDSAQAYLESRLFDHVRDEYIDDICDQINSDQYPEFSIYKNTISGHWVLRRKA